MTDLLVHSGYVFQRLPKGRIPLQSGVWVAACDTCSFQEEFEFRKKEKHAAHEKACQTAMQHQGGTYRVVERRPRGVMPPTAEMFPEAK